MHLHTRRLGRPHGPRPHTISSAPADCPHTHIDTTSQSPPHLIPPAVLYVHFLTYWPAQATACGVCTYDHNTSHIGQATTAIQRAYAHARPNDPGHHTDQMMMQTYDSADLDRFIRRQRRQRCRTRALDPRRLSQHMGGAMQPGPHPAPGRLPPLTPTATAALRMARRRPASPASPVHHAGLPTFACVAAGHHQYPPSTIWRSQMHLQGSGCLCPPRGPTCLASCTCLHVQEARQLSQGSRCCGLCEFGSRGNSRNLAAFRGRLHLRSDITHATSSRCCGAIPLNTAPLPREWLQMRARTARPQTGSPQE